MTTSKKLITLVSFAILMTPLATHAGLIPECATGAGLCGVNDIVQTFVNFTRFLLGFVGAAVLVMFVYGGFVWLTSAGGEGVKKGMMIVRNAAIGLVIVFAAYTGVQFIFEGLSAKKEAQIGQECTQGTDRGIYALVTIAQNQPPSIECVTTCGGTKLPGYACMDPAQGAGCVFGLCSDANQGCCQAP